MTPGQRSGPRMLRTRSVLQRGQQAAEGRGCPASRSRVVVAQPADLQVRARGELDDAVAESRRPRDRLELARTTMRPPGSAHARQPAVLRGRAARARRGSGPLLGVLARRLSMAALSARRFGPPCSSHAQSDAVAGAPARRARKDRLAGHDALRGAGEDEADRRPEHELHADRGLAEAVQRDRRERLRHLVDRRQQAPATTTTSEVATAAATSVAAVPGQRSAQHARAAARRRSLRAARSGS